LDFDWEGGADDDDILIISPFLIMIPVRCCFWIGFEDEEILVDDVFVNTVAFFNIVRTMAAFFFVSGKKGKER
jgi:hypothetical protein